MDLGGMSAAQVLEPFVAVPLRAQQCQPADPVVLNLRFASFNVLTLSGAVSANAGKKREVGLSMQVAKPFLLAKSFQVCGVAVAALQESRCEQGSLVIGNYLRFCSGAEGGNLGTELWFRVGHPLLIAKDHKVVFKREEFCVRHVDLRRILVDFSTAGFSVVFASLHAPHRAVEAHLIQDWWQETSRLCRQIRAGRPMLVGGDFNASVGSETSCSVDDVDPDVQDFAGGCFHEFLAQVDGWLPSTFSAHHSGQSWTYKHKRGAATARIDFIVLPIAWRCSQVTSCVASDIHAGQIGVDQLAVVCEAQVLVHGLRGRQAPSRRKIDVKAICEPGNRDRVCAIVNSAPQVPWHISSHAHAAILVEHLQKGLCEAFPLQRGDKGHRFVSQDALDVRLEVAQVRRACCRLRKHVHLQKLRVFNVWNARKTRDACPSLHDFLHSP